MHLHTWFPLSIILSFRRLEVSNYTSLEYWVSICKYYHSLTLKYEDPWDFRNYPWDRKNDKNPWDFRTYPWELASLFGRLSWGNLVRWFRIWYCQQRMINFYCLRLKSNNLCNLTWGKLIHFMCERNSVARSRTKFLELNIFKNLAKTFCIVKNIARTLLIWQELGKSFFELVRNVQEFFDLAGIFLNWQKLGRNLVRTFLNWQVLG